MTVLVLRPYSRRLRSIVFPLMERAGVTMKNALIIEAGTSDEDALTLLKGVKATVLLVPFHAHRDSAGKIVNGLELLALVYQRYPNFIKAPVFMPISTMGMSSASMMLSRGFGAGGVAASTCDRVLFMPEDELDKAGLSKKMKDHHRPFLTP